MRSRLTSVLVHSEIGIKGKVKMLYQGLFPVRWAKRELNKQLAELKSDVMD